MTRVIAATAAAIFGAVLAVGMFGAGTANAEDGKHWYFDVENQSNDTAIELRTQIHLTDGGYFDAPVDYCKAKTLVIQQGTLVWK